MQNDSTSTDVENETAPISLLYAETTPMSKEDSKSFMQLYMMELRRDTTVDELLVLDDTVAREIGPLCQIFHARLATCSPGTHVSALLAAWLCHLSKGSPGNAIMWAYAMHRMAINFPEGSLLNMSRWTQAFPMGVPSEDGYSRVWGAQKGAKGHNRLDDPLVWRMP
jgi:hypothetical protein